jgi:hypothetical protein
MVPYATNFIASDATASDNFGYSISCDGSSMIVGARNKPNGSTNTGAGAVYIYETASSSSWIYKFKDVTPIIDPKFVLTGDSTSFAFNNASATVAITAPIVALSTAKFYGKCLGFSNSSTKYVTVSNVGSPTIWTLEFWAYSTFPTGTRCQLTNHYVNNNQGVSFSGQQVNFDGDGLSTPWFNLVYPCYMQWHHYAFVRDGVTFKGFQDGILIGTSTNPASVMMGPTFSLGIPRSAMASVGFTGYVNDIILTKTAKYSSNFTPSQYVMDPVGLPSASLNFNLGHSVSIYGNSAVSGEPGNNKVYAYANTNGTWSRTSTLSPVVYLSTYKFGNAVAVFSETVLVGAPGYSSSAGSAYVYESGVLKQQLTFPGAAPNYLFGYSASASSGGLFVGAPGTANGNVYWYATYSSTPVKISASDPSSGDGFGFSICSRGNYLIVGAPYWDQKAPSAITNCGCAYVYYYSSSKWNFQARITAGDVTTSDLFGSSVYISDNYAMVGAPGKECTYVFKKNNFAWNLYQVSKASDLAVSDALGTSVACTDSYLLASAPGWEGSATDQGAVYYSFLKPLSVSFAVTNCPVANKAGGSITLTVSGGVTPYSYAWSSVSNFVSETCTVNVSSVSTRNTSSITGIYAGNYAVTVTDGLKQSCAVTPIPVTQMSVAPGMVTHSAGTVGAVTVTGGSGSYTITWTPTLSPNLNEKTGLSAGRYVCVVADSVNPTSTISITYDLLPSSTLSQYITSDAISDSTIYACSVYEFVCALGDYTQNSVFVFRRSNSTVSGTWVYESTFTGTDDFGYSTCVNGLGLAVGAPRLSGEACGKVSVYAYADGWTKTCDVTRDAAGDNFGFSVSLLGDSMFVGSPGSDCVFVYSKGGGTWNLSSTWNPTSSSKFGYSVKSWGNFVAVGAPSWSQTTPFALQECGAVYVYTKGTAAWTYQLIIAPDQKRGASYGCAVSGCGSNLVVGSENWSSISVNYCGCCYLYGYDTTTSSWTSKRRITAGDLLENSKFGCSVDLNSELVVVGSSQISRVYAFAI